MAAGCSDWRGVGLLAVPGMPEDGVEADEDGGRVVEAPGCWALGATVHKSQYLLQR